MLHRTDKMRGYHVHATDGEIGHVDDFLVDEKSWSVRYLVVNTSNWIGGRSVLISPSVVASIDSPASKIEVTLTRDQIKHSPSIEHADIVLAENLPTVWIM
jgi:PRC-barrel domain